ncbi:hypothetical protein BD779DRAFT_1484289 [Infundibulicybe gibba]|nr:hypothetical protein BD779DRAFT_1484289 [Infundibulicybe gibba]
MPPLSHQTIIIIAACSSVAAIVVVFIFVRITRSIYYRAKHKPVPLPPKQPLAHHREQQIAKFESLTTRDSDRSDHSRLSAPQRIPNSPRGSKSSLLGHESIPSRHNSYTPASEMGEDLGNLSPLELPSPNPTFQIPNPSSTSLPLTDVDSTASPSVRSPQFDSPTSTVSRAGPRSFHPSAARGTTRGPPHSRLNQVQIVLPTPLAPEMMTYMPSGSPASEKDALDRLSVVDKWVPTAVRSSLPSDRKSSSSVELRTSNKPTASSHLQVHLAPRRVSSNPSPLSPSYQSPPNSVPSTSAPPPVPRIPSIHSPEVIAQGHQANSKTQKPGELLGSKLQLPP